MVTVAIKETSYSNKSLFPKLNQGRHTCFIAKEKKHEVKTNGISSPKYVCSDDDNDSDDDTLFSNGINEKAVIKN
jgi:hypothetical protein